MIKQYEEPEQRPATLGARIPKWLGWHNGEEIGIDWYKNTDQLDEFQAQDICDVMSFEEEKPQQ